MARAGGISNRNPIDAIASLYQLFVFRDVFAGKVAERNAVRTIVGALGHEGVVRRVHIADHRAHVAQARQRLVVCLEHAHIGVRIQAAEHGEKCQHAATALAVERPLLERVHVVSALVEVVVGTLAHSSL